MSYSYRLKAAMCKQKQSACCVRSELAGFLLQNGISDGRVSFTLRHGDIFGFVMTLVSKVAGEHAGNVFETKSGAYTFTASQDTDCKLKNMVKEVCTDNAVSFCCVSAFLRGLFIGGGFIADPTVRFHFEIVLPDSETADIVNLFFSKTGISAHRGIRRGKTVLYIKRSDTVAEFLATVGLHRESFGYVNAGIEKNVVNTVNRQVNCETGNINKSVAAAEKQLKAIEYFRSHGFEGLAKPLVDIAVLRTENPEANIAELAAMLDPPVSKSGAAHRLDKIIRLYEKDVTD